MSTVLLLKLCLNLSQKRFNDVYERFKQFQSSKSDLEPHLIRVLRELRGVEEATCLLDIASDDLEGIEGQLKHCMVNAVAVSLYSYNSPQNYIKWFFSLHRDSIAL